MRGIATQAEVTAIEANGPPTNLPGSTYEAIRRTAAAHPEAPALSFFLRTIDHTKPETWNYRQLFAQITRTANLFHSLGADKDHVIAFVLPNLPETHLVIWGGQAAGIVAAVNPMLEPEAIAELLKAMDASILVTLAPYPGTDLWQRLRPALGRVGSLRHVLLVSLAEHVVGTRRWAARMLQWREACSVARSVRQAPAGNFRIHEFDRALRRQPADRLLSGRRIHPDDYSSFFCTGGTTGAPKIAMRRHRNEVANAWSAAQVLGDGIGPGKNIFCGLPLFHVNGAMVTGLLPFSRGAHVVLGTPQGYRGKGVIEKFWSIVERHRIHFFSAVPTVYSALLQVPRGECRVESLEYGICGAAPMPRELLNRFQQETGVRILEGYGLTEATCVSSLNPPLGERRSGSIGLRLPGQAMKAVILDASGNYQRDALDDEPGVLVVSGPNVFAGYRLEEQNQGIWLDLGDGERWLHTGDLARRDAEGYFWLTGRTKELIIRGGHNIDPAVIEQPLYAHPSVQLVAAVGRPDSYAGELPVAYVQLKPHQQAEEAELLAYLSERISERAAMPKSITVIDEMPLTPVGKIFKPELRRRQVGQALQQALDEAGVQVRSVHIEADEGKHGVCTCVTLTDDRTKPDVAAVLDRFPFPYRLT
ncbi:acyl-CoA synthetase [Lysobacter terrae]